MSTKLILLFSFLVFNGSFAEANNPTKKTLDAHRHDDQIKVDGLLDESQWTNASKADEFIQYEPNVGQSATFESKVSIIYDDYAVYIGAILKDPETKKILKELSIRDNMGNADNFTVFFDPYNSGLNGFLFKITASGVQLDAIVSNNDEDFNWNSIWQSAVTINEDNWTVEIKIPFSSLRFTSQEQQSWGIQFKREIRRFRETSHWSPIDPLINGWVQQSGILTNLKNIKTPIRLGLFPYISGYIDHYSDKKNIVSQTKTAYNAGLDIKYGINDAFTLDMTVIPDFGQVISDKQVLNLTPFEVFFEENRQFFTEGTELFNKGNLFYSRRIGGRPFNYHKAETELAPGEELIENPDVSQLYNATKISGRTSNGTGLGFFNAIVGETKARIKNLEGAEREILTNPLTNYNVLVLDKNMKNNSFFSLMNTNVMRNGRAYDANASMFQFDLKDARQMYHVGGDVSLTQKLSKNNNDAGFAYNVSAGKISGKWNYDVSHGIISVHYDPNDMGFLFRANEQYTNVVVKRQEFKPKNKKLQKWEYSLQTAYRSLYQPGHYTNFNLTFNTFYLWKSRNAVGGYLIHSPWERRDYFEPRTFDFINYLSHPSSLEMGAFFSSDYRKPLALDIRFEYTTFQIKDRTNYSLLMSPRFRFSDKFSIFPSLWIAYNTSEPGYVNKSLVDYSSLDFSPNQVMIGVRNRFIVENTFNIRWIFNNNLGINTRIRHYYDNVQQNYFGKLNANGLVDKINFEGTNIDGQYVFDRNINIFNIDLQLNWRFLPGSDMVFVWKNQIFSSGSKEEIDYFQNVSNLINEPQTNSFSIRFLMFIDYLYLDFLKKV
ncbi:MAG: DUF5916 domain-containing protein [Saprospiraceae bacterium]